MAIQPIKIIKRILTVMRLLLILEFIVLLTGSVVSQSDSIKLAPKTENYIQLNYENDLFNATDRYYTQGIQLSIIHPSIKYSPLTKTLFRLKRNAVYYYGLHLQQACYTPRSIRIDTILYGDRPYAGVFYISHSLYSLSKIKKLMLQTQLDVGIIGNFAYCEEEQKAIHKAVNNLEPIGWSYQLKNDIVLNYRTRVEKAIIYKKCVELLMTTNLRVGTLYNDIAFGLHSRIGLFEPYFTNLGLSKGSDAHPFKCFLQLMVNQKIVVYNASLQGGLFTKSVYELPTTAINRFVFDAEAGIVLAYKRWSLEFTRTYLTPEFNGGLEHGWGRCRLTLMF
jgi:lipid A 3-O-deacylase